MVMVRAIEAMLGENAGGLARAWRERLEREPAVLGALSGPMDDGLLLALVEEFVRAMCRKDPSEMGPLLPERTSAVSVFVDPRDDAALWLEILSAGRSVLESFLIDSVVPAFRLEPDACEALLDELERAFHMVAHRRLQVLCECCLTPR